MKKSIHSNQHSVLIARLIDARKVAGLTQQAVADLLHKPQSFVAKYENGERRLDVVEFLQVVTALGVEPCSIINELLDET